MDEQSRLSEGHGDAHGALRPPMPECEPRGSPTRQSHEASENHLASISERVEQARAGTLESAVCRMPSGWAVMGDAQVLEGYCVLIADPVVPNLNALDEAGRARFLVDMTVLGDAILEVTGALRINYEILGNADPGLHAHVFPRFADETPERRRMPVWFYDWDVAPRFDPAVHGALRQRLQEALARRA